MKALMVAIQPKWLKMILDGEKKFEFRNWKIPVGTVIYFYESQGKRKKGYCTRKSDGLSWPCNDCIAYADGEPPFDGCTRNLKLTSNPPYDGRGKVVAKVVVKGVSGWEKENAFRLITNNGYPVRFRINDFTFIGFDENKPSKYAIELDQVEEIKPKDVTEFVSWSKLTKYKDDINKLERNTGAVGYFIKDEEQSYAIGKSWESIEENAYQNLKWDMYVTKPPQSRTWIYVEEE